jgi:hypothetical protein
MEIYNGNMRKFGKVNRASVNYDKQAIFFTLPFLEIKVKYKFLRVIS